MAIGDLDGDLDGDGKPNVVAASGGPNTISVFHNQALEGVSTVDVSLPHVTATYNQTLQIPVQLGDTSGGDIVAAEVFVSYDGDLLTALSTGLAGTLAEVGWSAETNIIEGSGTNIDTVKIAMATDNDVLSGAGDLIHIDFQMRDVRTPASSPLTLEHVIFNDGVPINTRADGLVTLVGVDGSIVHDLTQIIPRQDIAVTVTDADEDRNTGGQDSFAVRVSNGSQTETLTVQETDISTGVFTGTISTVFSPGATSGDNTVERCTSTLVIGGTDGIISTTIVSQPGDTVRVRVTDADLNTDTGTPQTVDVTTVNPTTGETGIVTLAEDGNDSDIFFGLLFTTPGTTPGTSGDATLNTQKADILDITYTDVVTGLGGTEDLTDDNEVVDPFGDADGNGAVQAFDAAKALLHTLNPYLTGLDSLSANLDLFAFNPYDGTPPGKITPFDASLILQKRVGILNRFPVQEDEANNHPQPETDNSTPKFIPEERTLALQRHDGYLSVWTDRRDDILSGELVIEGISGQLQMGDDLSDFLSASRHTDSGTHIVFAGAVSVNGPGELLRIYSGVGPADPQFTRISLNDGQIDARIDETVSAASPSRLALYPNVPNPFNPETTIRFDLPSDNQVRLKIFDVVGQQVRTLMSGYLPTGSHQVVWDGRNEEGMSVANGVYFYRLQAGDVAQIRRMLLIK